MCLFSANRVAFSVFVASDVFLHAGVIVQVCASAVTACAVCLIALIAPGL